MRQSLRADTEAVEKLGEAVETWEVSAAAVAELLVTGVAEQRVVVAKAAAVDSGVRAADNCSWVEEEGVSDLKALRMERVVEAAKEKVGSLVVLQVEEGEGVESHALASAVVEGVEGVEAVEKVERVERPEPICHSMQCNLMGPIRLM
jgi:hypothetical protein